MGRGVEVAVARPEVREVMRDAEMNRDAVTLRRVLGVDAVRRLASSE
jgi:hypothetical protein